MKGSHLIQMKEFSFQKHVRLLRETFRRFPENMYMFFPTELNKTYK